MTETPTIPDLIEELRWRGLLHQCTDEPGLREHLATGTRRVYCGFDPTADSLTIGNLVPIMLLAHVKRAGHEPVVVMGGGTGLIGDPSGKSAERTLMTPETVAQNIAGQRPIFDAVLGAVAGPAHTVVNNLDWLGSLSYIDALRDIGKHFSVNMMMQKESVKARLENREQGISYTEFSYMILQAYDFAHLYEHEGVTVQVGGSDQYGNIVAGTDLVRRITVMYWSDAIQDAIRMVEAEGRLKPGDHPLDLSDALRSGFGSIPKDLEVKENASRLRDLFERLMEYWVQNKIKIPDFVVEHLRFRCQKLAVVEQGATFGLTAPLVTKADGGKFGKTETGAVWLTAERTSPYAYYQFWLNATDDDARNWIKVFTFLDEPTINDLTARHDEAPHKRELQRTLAREATRILHGPDAMERAEAAGRALFSGELAGLDEATLNEVFADVPSSTHSRADLEGEGVDPVALLKQIGLASSNREAREFLANGSVSVNGEKIGLETRLVSTHLLHGSVMAIRRGKKKWHLARWA